MRLTRNSAIGIAVLVGAFLARLVFILQTKSLPFYYHAFADAGFFSQWAALKSNVTWIDMGPAFREPLYAYFLGLVYEALRESLTVARLVQAVLGSCTALLVYYLAKAAYGRLAAIIAGVVFALYVTAIFFAAEINETTLLVFLLVASAYLVLRAAQSRAYLNAWLAGVIVGAAFLCRFSAVAALPAWAACLLASRERRVKQAAALLVAGFLILPAAYHLLLVRGSQWDVVPLRTDWQSFLGSGSVGGTVRLPHYDVPIGSSRGAFRATASPDWGDGQKDAIRLAQVESGEALTSDAASRHWRGRTLSDFKARPARYLKNYFTKLGLFWGPSEPPANIDSRFVAGYSLLLKNVLLSFAVIAPLGLVGLLRRGRTLLHLSIFVPLYSAVVALSLVTDSDKIVVVPFLAVFAGALVAEMVSTARSLRMRRSLTYALTAAIVGVVLCLFPRSPMDKGRQATIQGDIYREETIFDKAEAAYREAIKASPDSPDGYIQLSRIYGGAWKPDQALSVLAGASGAASEDPRLMVEKTSVLFMLARYDEAIEVARRVAESHPFEPRVHEMIGISLLAKGDVEGALAELRQEVEYTGGGFVTYSALGKACLDLGRYSEASSHLEQAFRLNPSNAQVAMQLADSYNRTEQYLRACDVLSKVLSADPGNMPVRFKFANSLYRAGRYADALKQFKDLSTFDPRNADVMLNMGTVYAAMDSTALAIQMWEKALTLDPQNQPAKENLEEARKAR